VLWNGPSRLIPGYNDGLPVAKTKQGLARGDMWTSRDGRYFNVFRGIPYAKQPIGERRFQQTEPLDTKDRWEGIKDFNWEMPHCYQVDMVTGFHVGKEDCLKLNIFKPDLSTDKLLPVMVWIHGGGFVVGDSGTALFGPHYFMDHDVVLVTLHYRLGPLGFLSLGTEDLSGNQGLWDQRMALYWVKQNIKSFGGDPKQVTIFGESAGSMAVNSHILSPQSKGLFNKAIMQSGTVISTFLKSNKHSARDGLKYAEAVGCSNKPGILVCLQSVPVKDLYNSVLMFDQDCPIRDDLGLAFLGPWKPSVDSFLEKPFLPKDPKDILLNGEENDVSAIIGFNQEDGLLFTTRFIKDPSIQQDFFDNEKVCGPIYFLGQEKDLITEHDMTISNRIIKSYSSSDTNTTFEEFTDLFTDAVFGAGTHQLANNLVENNRKVFKYIYSYKGSSSLGDIFSYSLLKKAFYLIARLFRMYPTEGLGACHADDLIYLFQMTPIINMIPSTSDRKVSEDMVKMWVTFAQTGDPNSEGENTWTQAELDNEFDYFVIDEHSRMEKREELKRLNVWNHI